ncbi:MAG: FIST N-terminal domain-containing protein, partial [Selenomonas artemidis]
MQQLSYIAARAEDVRRTAEKAKEKLDRLPHIETLLITAVLPCSVPIEDARALRDSMRELFPAARILVHTSALKMAEMHLDNDGIMLVFLTFESSQADFLMIRSETADEATKRHFVDFVAERPHTKLAGFFVVGMIDRIDDILASFSDIDERIEVFGAFVDAAPMQARGYILADDEEMTQGTLAVVFGGETLAACVTRNFGWNMLGREIVATHVDGCT